MKQLKPVYSKHVVDLITQLEDIIESHEETLYAKWVNLDPSKKIHISWEGYKALDKLRYTCYKEIQRIKDTQLPMFYELV